MREYTEQEQIRREKLTEISKVCNPYPDRFVFQMLVLQVELFL